MEWFREWFGPLYEELYTHRNRSEAQQQVQVLLDRIGPIRGWVLDAGCGAGRHLEILQSQGIKAIGCDLSMHLLQRAHQTGGSVFRCDLRQIPVQNFSFGLVASFFTGFGYLDRPSDDAKLFTALACCVAPGGVLHLDLPNPIRVKSDLVARDQKRIKNMWVHQTRVIQNDTVTKTIRVTRDDGTSGVYLERVRLWERNAIERLARVNGLQPVGCIGGLDGHEAHEGSLRMGLLFRRSGRCD